MAVIAEHSDVSVVSWPGFVRRMHWLQGEHVTLIGPTSSGKSHVATLIAGIRQRSLVLGTKPRDRTLEGFRSRGWRVIRSWPPPPLRPRVILWPKVQQISDLANQRRAFRDALDDVYARGGWSIYVDELHIVANTLGLGDRLELLWLQGRSLGVSLMASVQRPAHVPLVAYSQATHVLCWATRDARDLKRLAEISGTVDTRRFVEIVQQLPPYAFAHANARTGKITVSKAPPPKE